MKPGVSTTRGSDWATGCEMKMSWAGAGGSTAVQTQMSGTAHSVATIDDMKVDGGLGVMSVTGNRRLSAAESASTREPLVLAFVQRSDAGLA